MPKQLLRPPSMPGSTVASGKRTICFFKTRIGSVCLCFSQSCDTSGCPSRDFATPWRTAPSPTRCGAGGEVRECVDGDVGVGAAGEGDCGQGGGGWVKARVLEGPSPPGHARSDGNGQRHGGGPRRGLEARGGAAGGQAIPQEGERP